MLHFLVCTTLYRYIITDLVFLILMALRWFSSHLMKWIVLLFTFLYIPSWGCLWPTSWKCYSLILFISPYFIFFTACISTFLFNLFAYCLSPPLGSKCHGRDTFSFLFITALLMPRTSTHSIYSTSTSTG